MVRLGLFEDICAVFCKARTTGARTLTIARVQLEENRVGVRRFSAFEAENVTFGFSPSARFVNKKSLSKLCSSVQIPECELPQLHSKSRPFATSALIQQVRTLASFSRSRIRVRTFLGCVADFDVHHLLRRVIYTGHVVLLETYCSFCEERCWIFLC